VISQIRSRAARASRFLTRVACATGIVVRRGDIPRPIKWLAVLGLLPVPGPLDEMVLLFVAAILFLFYRPQLRDAWRDASRDSDGYAARR